LARRDRLLACSSWSVYRLLIQGPKLADSPCLEEERSDCAELGEDDWDPLLRRMVWNLPKVFTLLLPSLVEDLIWPPASMGFIRL
jgi:hypothetical protein